MTEKSLMSKKQSHRARVTEKFNRSYINNIRKKCLEFLVVEPKRQ